MKIEYTDEELLNWAMNQLYRATRTMQLMECCNAKGSDTYSTGCDLTAETILERLKSTKSGRNLIKETNPKLLRQVCPAKIRELMKYE